MSWHHRTNGQWGYTLTQTIITTTPYVPVNDRRQYQDAVTSFALGAPQPLIVALGTRYETKQSRRHDLNEHSSAHPLYTLSAFLLFLVRDHDAHSLYPTETSRSITFRRYLFDVSPESRNQLVHRVQYDSLMRSSLNCNGKDPVAPLRDCCVALREA